MNLPRLTPDNMEPALYVFLLHLSLDICIDKRAFGAWVQIHQVRLSADFVATELEPSAFEGWAREQYFCRKAVNA